MKILAIDDELLPLKLLTNTIAEARPDDEIYSFSKPVEAIECAEKTDIDVAFLDIEMFGMNGLELAKRLKEINSKTGIVFVTGYSEYAIDAFSLHVNGYILKPPTVDRIQKEIEYLNQDFIISEPHIRVHTFGCFDIFVNGVPVKFIRSKSKEVLAYLIDRQGASVSLANVAAIIFEDKEYTRSVQNQMQVYISDMMKSLKNAKIADIVIKNRNSYCVDVSKFDCDYYNFLKMDATAVNSYCGEYMSNYSWAELTTGWINDRIMQS